MLHSVAFPSFEHEWDGTTVGPDAKTFRWFRTNSPLIFSNLGHYENSYDCAEIQQAICITKLETLGHQWREKFDQDILENSYTPARNYGMDTTCILFFFIPRPADHEPDWQLLAAFFEFVSININQKTRATLCEIRGFFLFPSRKARRRQEV